MFGGRSRFDFSAFHYRAGAAAVADELNSADLVGEWFHSHEEDQGDQMVFRPASYAFPPARMPRQQLDLAPGGRLRRGLPGPDDRRQASEGRWELDGRALKLETPGGPSEEYDVESKEGDRLVVRRRG